MELKKNMLIFLFIKFHKFKNVNFYLITKETQKYYFSLNTFQLIYLYESFNQGDYYL